MPDRLSATHLRLVPPIAGRYAGKGVDWDDLVGEGQLALVLVERAFNKDHGTDFRYYAPAAIHRAMRRRVRVEAERREVPLSADIPLDYRPDPIDSLEAADFVASRFARLTPAEAEVIRLRFGLDGEVESLAADAARTGSNRQTVLDVQRRALKKMAREVR